MKLSSNEEYGLRCLLQIARRGESESATIPDISSNEGISAAYAGKLLRILRQGGFVRAARGKVGGYTLALPPERICVGDVLATLGGRLYEDGFCTRHSGTQISCVHSHSTDCSMRSLWRSVQDAVDSILRGTTLHHLLHSEYDTVTAGELGSEFIHLRDCSKRNSNIPASTK